MEYVLDSSAILTGSQFAGELLTVPQVLEEIRRRGLTLEEEIFVEQRVRVFTAEEAARAIITAAARRTGDDARLSPTDAELLALAVERKATLVTDDYAIQNVARVVGVPFVSVAQSGIRKVIQWYHRCSGCARYFDGPQKECPVCGSPVRTTRRAPQVP